MYLVISLVSILGLALGIVWVVARKLPYLKKLPIDSEQKMAGGFLWEFFPELHQRYRQIDLTAYQGYLLREFEKFLRRLKVISLKLETFSNRLIRKIKTNGNYHSGSTVRVVAVETVKSAEETVKIFTAENVIDYKKEEQSLIIEIAKDPKNPELYRRLGDIYIVMKNFLDAKDSLTTSLKFDPDDERTKEKLVKLQTMLPM